MASSALDPVLRLLEQYGYLAVIIAIFGEDFGLPLPGESMLIAGALAAAAGRLEIVPLLLLAWGAAVVGDNVGYAIGRYGGHALIHRYGRYVLITPDRLERVERFFARYGGAVVLVARFVAGLRQLNGLVAGALGMPWWEFVAFNAAGAALWVGAWGFGIYWFGDHGLRMLHSARGAEPYLIAGLVVVFAGAAIWLWRRDRAGRASPPPSAGGG
jgi:membrane protein DedA with SNARE-associated domain